MRESESPHGVESKSGKLVVGADGGHPIRLAVMILAKDEEQNIGMVLKAISTQTLCARGDVTMAVFVVSNGSSDRTAEVAREQAAAVLEPVGVTTQVFDWPTPGKSRSWNRVVHELIPADVDWVLAVDADIEFADEKVLSSLVDHGRRHPDVEVVSGFAVKDTARKVNPTLVDRFSLSISRQTRHSGVINGSLYLARTSCLREIWLPDDTPGEDGFLNAMVMTKGFSRTERPEAVGQLSEPTHYFEGHSPVSYFAHEKRMIVGTMINRWIFEYLHSLKLKEPAGPMIGRLNREEPDWVEKIISRRSKGKWLIPNDLTLRRLKLNQRLNASYVIRLPLLLLATALTLPPALNANKVLKKRGASSIW